MFWQFKKSKPVPVQTSTLDMIVRNLYSSVVRKIEFVVLKFPPPQTTKE